MFQLSNLFSVLLTNEIISLLNTLRENYMSKIERLALLRHGTQEEQVHF